MTKFATAIERKFHFKFAAIIDNNIVCEQMCLGELVLYKNKDGSIRINMILPSATEAEGYECDASIAHFEALEAYCKQENINYVRGLDDAGLGHAIHFLRFDKAAIVDFAAKLGFDHQSTVGTYVGRFNAMWENQNEQDFYFFKQDYLERYHATFFKNPFSTMRAKLKSGDISTIDQVREYVKANPTSRSRRCFSNASPRST